MSLKSFLFPLTIAVIAFVIVGFVKPEVLSLIEKTQIRKERQSEFETLGKTDANIRTLSGRYAALSQDGTVPMVMALLPRSVEQDQIVWTMNRLAEQSGVVLVNMAFSERMDKSDGSTIVSMETAPSGSAAVPTLPDAKVVSASVNVNGSYSGVKMFFEKFSSISRLNRVNSFFMEKSSTRGPDGADVSSDLLSGSIDADFFFLPLERERYANGYLLPIFHNETFDISPIERISGTSVDPGVSSPFGFGRSNPFMP